MYVKPRLERFGSLRELTRIGLNADCDGGVWGIAATDGSWWRCEDSSRS